MRLKTAILVVDLPPYDANRRRAVRLSAKVWTGSGLLSSSAAHQVQAKSSQAKFSVGSLGDSYINCGLVFCKPVGSMGCEGCEGQSGGGEWEWERRSEERREGGGENGKGV